MVITARSDNRSLGIADLEQVLIHFISALVIGRVQGMTRGR